jgi:hypothetical protein
MKSCRTCDFWIRVREEDSNGDCRRQDDTQPLVWEVQTEGPNDSVLSASG